MAFPCALCCYILHFVIREQTELLKYEQVLSSVGGSVLGGFTTILGFLIVFRSQQAYSRWWEGGSLLQQIRGEWFNAYSGLLAFCSHAHDKEDEVHLYQHKL